MGNFWTDDGKLTANHINRHDNMLQLDNGKIVSKNTWDRFNKIAWRKNAMPLVDPVDISPPPTNAQQLVSEFKKSNEESLKLNNPLNEEEIKEAKNNNRELITNKGWQGADGGPALSAKEMKARGVGPNVFVSETTLKDNRSSTDIISERDKAFQDLVKKDTFINEEFWKTVVASNQDNIDNKLKLSKSGD